MKIYCVRHGHAELEADANGERQLSSQGIAEVSKVANYLLYRGVHISHVMHSNKQRAIDTAKILTEKLAGEVQPEETALLLPESPISPLVEQIMNWDDDTLLVGHMPFISLLVSRLVVGNDMCNLVRFTPGTVVCLERYEGTNWIINWIVRPDLVPDKFL